MVKVGFVVEGVSDKKLIESATFKNWAKQECGLEILDDVVDAGGNRNLCSQKIEIYVQKLMIQAQPDKIVVLADLDPEECVPCITERKKMIGNKDIDLVVIARKAMESWFLADTQAMRRWLEDDHFQLEKPEETDVMPWDYIKKLGTNSPKQRGPGSKKVFARKFIRDYGFDVCQAAKHPNCPSSQYFIMKLSELA
ncbi:MAG TPA: hypothetical protein DCM38_00885 [Gammaproteobacteria bacterium]|nr:hypothetical protein [Candidatus Parabeggiatoa sp.]HAI67973.1 hypothetical protein [Gammaproteobacteria bacterium]